MLKESNMKWYEHSGCSCIHRLLRLLGANKHEDQSSMHIVMNGSLRSLNAKVAQPKSCPVGVNIMTELQNKATTECST